MFEHKSHPMASVRTFATRISKHLAVTLVVIVGSWMAGIAGYKFFEDMSWIDATLNAAMILGGMGPVSELHTVSGKLFASFYAIYSGLVLIATAGVVLAPFLHRVLHRIHLEDKTPAD